MYRYAMEELKSWKIQNERKPLIIEGARQVGKTWLMKEFGKHEYDQVVYVNFDSNRIMEQLFDIDLHPKRLISGIEIYAQTTIIPETTLLIFDEIQEVPRVLASLKYFMEEAPQYHIICAGSLLGIALHQGTSFPVGKADFLSLYPLSFKEFLLAMGKEQLVKLLDMEDPILTTAFKQMYIDALKQYYLVGGMPEVVKRFATDENFPAVRSLQNNILNAYEQDMSKHAPISILPKIRMLFHSIPSQLAKENKKFIYGLIKEGARAKEFENALLWLSDCGIIHIVYQTSTPSIPLKAYEDQKAFKVYFIDVGLLCALAGIDARTILDKNELFREFKGSITEQYVLQQLMQTYHTSIWYYSNERNSAEVDFLISDNGQVIPIEVQASENLQAKRLKTYRAKFSPPISIRTSLSDYRDEGWLVNLPLYAVSQLNTVLETKNGGPKTSI